MRFRLAVTVLSAAVSPAYSGASHGDYSAKIHEIETGLRSVVSVEGERPVLWALAARMTHHHVPGVSIAVIADGKIVIVKGYGFKERGSSIPVTADTVFQSGSISKPVAALGTLRLIERGTFDLDTDVNRYLKSWQVPQSELTLGSPVTLRGILSHTAGLSVHGFEGYAAGASVPSVQQILYGVAPANSPPVRVELRPRTVMRYSGGGTTVQQLLVEEATGAPYADYLSREVLQPLGMASSTYSQPLAGSLVARAASGHDGRGRLIAGRWHTYPERAAAGLWTTSADLCRYVLGVQGALAGDAGSILNPSTVREMLTVQVRGGRFGLGPGLWRPDAPKWFGHGGANEGYRARVVGSLQGGRGAAVLTNGDDGLELADEILASIASTFHWHDLLPASKKPVKLSRADLLPYEGRYESGDGALIQIVARKGFIEASVAGGSTRRFSPESAKRFFAREMALDLEFQRDDAGNLRLVLYDDGIEALRALRK